MNNISKKIEAILYSSREPLKASEISEYLGISTAEFSRAIREISRNYEEINSSLKVGQFGNSYKIKLSEDMIPFVEPFIEKEFKPIELNVHWDSG